MSSNPKILCQATASYQKKSGVLRLSTSKLLWSPKDTSQSTVSLNSAEINGLFASKAGAAEPKLKVSTESGASHTFAFPSPPDAEAFKGNLTTIVKRNNDRRTSGPASSTPSMSNPNATRPALSSVPGSRLPSGTTNLTVPPVSTPNSRASSVAPGKLEAFELRKLVLMRNPELAGLHRELVISGLISEPEFWQGREHLILAERAAQQQRRGKSSQIVDPRPVRDASGNAKTVLSKQMVQDIFEEFPVVKRAFNENVPRKLNEKEFWMRYLQSKLASRNSASARGAASEHTVKDDPIFDKYLEREDDGVEPIRPRPNVEQITIDLAANEEDHGETGNTKDRTMQAGKEKRALPLIRRFNEHSERLLNSALGPEPAAKRRRIVLGEDAGLDADYDDIVIEDLRASSTSQGISLEMKDQQRYFEGGRAGALSDGMVIEEVDPVDATAVVPQLVQSLDRWASEMATLRLDRPALDDALGKMTANVKARLDVKSRKDDLPDVVMQEVNSIQSASTEFLRQFWSAIYPDQLLPPAPPSQLAERAEKMAGYLAKTRDKVDGLAQAAPQWGVDPERIETIFAPTITAADTAIKTHRATFGKA